MKRKEIIKQLERDNEYLRYLNSEQEKKIEILKFKVEKGANPVEFVDTGDVHIFFGGKNYDRSEKYKVKYITTIGDIGYLNLGYLSNPEFEIKRNDERECIFTIRENQGSLVRWFKLFKDRRLVVDIPKPSFVQEEHVACKAVGAQDE